MTLGKTTVLVAFSKARYAVCAQACPALRADGLSRAGAGTAAAVQPGCQDPAFIWKLACNIVSAEADQVSLRAVLSRSRREL